MFIFFFFYVSDSLIAAEPGGTLDKESAAVYTKFAEPFDSSTTFAAPSDSITSFGQDSECILTI